MKLHEDLNQLVTDGIGNLSLNPDERLDELLDLKTALLELTAETDKAIEKTMEEL